MLGDFPSGKLLFMRLLCISFATCLFVSACARWFPTTSENSKNALTPSAPQTANSLSPTFKTPHVSTPATPVVAMTLISTPSISWTAAPSSTGAPSFSLCSPIEGFPLVDLPRIISVGYHPPPKGQDDRHEGVDFCFYRWKDLGSIEGKGAQSVLSGWIAAALDGTFPYGSFVIVETPAALIPQDLRVELKMGFNESLYVLYAHLQDQSLKVHLGQEVSSCQILGFVGRTGNTKAPHLHFETRIGPPGARFEGMSNFVDSTTEEERKNYRIWRIGGSYNHFDPMNLLSFGIEAAFP